MERVQLYKNMVERERMFHVRNGNVKRASDGNELRVVKTARRYVGLEKRE